MQHIDFDARLRGAAQAFADDITRLVKQAAIEAVREALDMSKSPTGRPARGVRVVTLTPEPSPFELQPVARQSTGGPVREEDVPLTLDAYERHAIVRALDENGGNVQAAADVLGLAKSSMYRRMVLNGIPRPHGFDGQASQFVGYLKLEGPVSLEAYERRAIERALEEAGGSQIGAAKLLGIGKSTMYRKLPRGGVG